MQKRSFYLEMRLNSVGMLCFSCETVVHVDQNMCKWLFKIRSRDQNNLRKHATRRDEDCYKWPFRIMASLRLLV